MSDIVKRLRKVDYGNPKLKVTTSWYRNPNGPEGADEIERLRKRVNELEKRETNANINLNLEIERLRKEREEIIHRLAVIVDTAREGGVVGELEDSDG